jgi:hypothetical protein
MYLHFFPVNFDLFVLKKDDKSEISRTTCTTVYAVATVYGAPGVNVIKAFDVMCDHGDVHNKKLLAERQQIWKHLCLQQFGTASLNSMHTCDL